MGPGKSRLYAKAGGFVFRQGRLFLCLFGWEFLLLTVLFQDLPQRFVIRLDLTEPFTRNFARFPDNDKCIGIH